jgi:hypothetical protein
VLALLSQYRERIWLNDHSSGSTVGWPRSHTKLDAATWARFAVWLAVGLVIYLLWGYRNSTLRRGGGGDSPGGRFQRRPSGAPAAPTPEQPH